MKKICLIITILIVLTLVNSCLNNVNVEKENIVKSLSDIERIEYQIIFPDTVYVNKPYNGKINYKSALDTIITTFNNKEKNRYTRFIMLTTDNTDYEFANSKKVLRDTFGALDNRTIPFYNIKFNKTGIHYIDGIINDIVLIDLFTKDEDGNDLSRLIENNERVTHKVVVIENKAQL